MSRWTALLLTSLLSQGLQVIQRQQSRSKVCTQQLCTEVQSGQTPAGVAAEPPSLVFSPQPRAIHNSTILRILLSSPPPELTACSRDLPGYSITWTFQPGIKLALTTRRSVLQSSRLRPV